MQIELEPIGLRPPRKNYPRRERNVISLVDDKLSIDLRGNGISYHQITLHEAVDRLQADERFYKRNQHFWLDQVE